MTALAIIAGGTFAYQYKAPAGWQAVIAAAVGLDFLVQIFVSETANADTEDWR